MLQQPTTRQAISFNTNNCDLQLGAYPIPSPPNSNISTQGVKKSTSVSHLRRRTQARGLRSRCPPCCGVQSQTCFQLKDKAYPSLLRTCKRAQGHTHNEIMVMHQTRLARPTCDYQSTQILID